MKTLSESTQLPTQNHKWLKFIWLGVILLAVLVVFSPVLKAGFINWDDRLYVLENPEIRSIDWTHVKTVFTSTALRGYVPLTVFSFALEYHFFGLNPFVFHLDNLILHLAVTGLIFFLGMRLGLGLLAAGLAALIFGIHPMHVESVAWVAERKDVLYALFYLLALHSYWSYLEDGRKRFYVFTMILGILSMLAKPMALSLPLILFMLDAMQGRRFTLKVFAEKIPHILAIIAIGMMTYRLYPRIAVFSSPWETVLAGIWSLMFYPAKFFWPDHFFLAYEQPQPIVLSSLPYLAAVIGLMITTMLIIIYFRKQRWLIFAVSFYVLSIFFLLRGSVLESIAVADRYMYLPSLGFCFLLGYLADQGWQRWKSARLPKIVISIVVIVVLGILSVKTFRQAQVWNNSLALWNNVLKYAPENNTAYYCRGDLYKQMGKYDLALNDMVKGLSIMPNREVEYFNRGTLFDDTGRSDLALKDYEATLKTNPQYVKAYSNQAFIYCDRKQYQDALAALNKAAEVEPKFPETFFNRGSVYAQLGDWDAAVKDYDTAIRLNPILERAYEYRSRVWAAKKEWAKALADARKAQSLGVTYAPEEMLELERNVKSF